MRFFQPLLNFLKKPGFLLVLLLLTFILKGLVFVVIMPMHQGSDEYIHYATVQYLAEPKEKTWPIAIEKKRTSNDTKDIFAFHYTEEIRKFSELTQSDRFSGQPHNTQDLSEKSVAYVEEEMRSGKYLPYINTYPPQIINKNSQLTHWIGSFVEKYFSDKSIFERYFAVRMLAIFYGLITIFCAYLIALWSGMRPRHALLAAGIIAFQPQFSATTAIVNYDPLLIALFSVFLAGSISILRHGLNLLNLTAIFAASIAALLAKGIGGILILFAAGITIWGLRQKFPRLKNIKLWKSAIAIVFIFAAILFTVPRKYSSLIILPSESRGRTIIKSLSSYVESNVLDSGRIDRTSMTYWGTFGWLDTQLHEQIVDYIQVISKISLIGLLILFLFILRDSLLPQAISKLFSFLKVLFPQFIRDFLKKFTGTMADRKSFLPQGKYLLLFVISITLLRVAIHFYDWRGGYLKGSSVDTPGRYFLPNIIPHMLLVFTGLGMFVKSPRAFGLILKSVFGLMVLLCLYAIFIIIIPRYYL